LFEKVLAAIKKDPKRAKKASKAAEKPKRQGDYMISKGKKWLSLKKSSKEQKRQNASR